MINQTPTSSFKSAPTAELKNKKNAREIILSAAQKLFAKRGFNGVTVRDLSKECGLSIGSMNYYFDNKKALYKECLLEFGLDELKTAERILQLPQNDEEFRIRLKIFCEEFFLIHIQKPELTTMIHRECEADSPFIEDLFHKSFQKIQTKLEEFFEHSKRNGFIREENDSAILSHLFMHSIVQFIRGDKLQSRFYGKTIQEPEYLKAIIEQIMTVFMRGILQDNSKGVLK